MLDKIIRLLSWIFFGTAVWLITKEVRAVGIAEIITVFAKTPVWIMGVMLMITVADYLVLSGYDVLALRYIGRHLPYGKIAEAAGIGFALSNTTGHVYAAGGAVRYLFYVPEGITKSEVLKIVIFETLTVFIGMATAYVAAVGMMPFESGLHVFKDTSLLYGTAVFIVLLFLIYDAKCVIQRRVFRVGSLSLTTPDRKMTIAQILLGFSDNVLLFLVFYAGLRYHIPTPFFETFVVFIMAQSIGLMTQVPGGLGVFESAFLYLFPHASAQKSVILMSLLLFRVMYYFVPFGIGCAYLGIRKYVRKTKFPSSV